MHTFLRKKRRITAARKGKRNSKKANNKCMFNNLKYFCLRGAKVTNREQRRNTIDRFLNFKETFAQHNTRKLCTCRHQKTENNQKYI